MTSSSSNTSPACLAIDCSGRDVYCGLISSDSILLTTPTGQRSVCSLIPSINDLYRSASIDPNQTRLIAVTYGPGAFTSLRIGITAAKTLGFCYDCPVVGVNSLDVYAAAISSSRIFAEENFEKKNRSENVPNRTAAFVVPCMNAFRNQVFCKFLNLRSDIEARESSASLISDRIKSGVNTVESIGVSEESSDCPTTDPKLLGTHLLTEGLQSEAYDLKHSQDLESEIAKIFFRQHCTTEILDNEAFLSEVNKIPSNELVLTGPEDWRNSLIKKEPEFGRLLDDGTCRWIIPSKEEVIAGIGRVAAEALPVLSTTERNAMALQPVYFRDSAAEENRKK